MTNRNQIEKLLTDYERAVGVGNMKNAGRTLPLLVKALVAFVEERTPNHIERDDERFPPDALEKAMKTVLNETTDASQMMGQIVGTLEPCVQCDVSIPNNPDLIEDFKPLVEPSNSNGTRTVFEIESDLTSQEVKEAITQIKEDIVGTVEDSNGDKLVDYVVEAETAEKLAEIGIDVEAEIKEAVTTEAEKEAVVTKPKKSKSE